MPLIDIQTAVDRVFAGEEVPVNPNSVGYRSAFIGAVLQSLPGVEVLHDPPRARLSKRAPAASYDLRAFLRSRRAPLDDPTGGSPFRIVYFSRSQLNYSRRRSSQEKTVAMNTLQEILDEVLARDDGSAKFSVELNPLFLPEHGDFAHAVIAAITENVPDRFEGFVPSDETGLGRDLHRGSGQHTRSTITAPHRSHMSAASDKLSAAQRDRLRRDLRRQYLAELGWTIIGDNLVIEPGVDPDEASVLWT